MNAPSKASVERARHWLASAPTFTWAPIWGVDQQIRRHAWLRDRSEERTVCGILAAPPNPVSDSSVIADCEDCRDLVAYPLARLLDEVRRRPALPAGSNIPTDEELDEAACELTEADAAPLLGYLKALRDRCVAAARERDSPEKSARRVAAERNAARFGWCSCPEPTRLHPQSSLCDGCQKVIPVSEG